MEKAKEAYRKERLLAKQREEKNLTDQSNPELTGFVILISITKLIWKNIFLFFFSVYFIKILLNIACQYSNAGNYTEALNIYSQLTKNKVFQLSGRLKTNIGNIYFQQKQYLKAIKMYRMALDQIPLTNQDLK